MSCSAGLQIPKSGFVFQEDLMNRSRLVRVFLVAATLLGTTLAMVLALNKVASVSALSNANGSTLQLSFPTLPPLRVVSIKKTTDADGDTKVGDLFAYTLEVKNATEQTATVQVTDTLPAEVELAGTPTINTDEGGISPTVNGQVVNWHGSVAKNQTVKIMIPVKLATCPAQHAWKSGVVNVATLKVEDRGVSVATVAFRPSGCGSPDATPTPPTSTQSSDVSVYKVGRLHLDWDRPERGWRASWYVGYRNRGSQTATDVVINDNPSSNQTLEAVRSWPVVSPTTSSDGLQFNIGSLARGRGGSIWLRTSLPVQTAAKTVLTNSVSISASNDAKLENNRSLVTITLPTLPPIITYPRSGATCTETISVTGKAQLSSTVQLFIDGSLVLTTTADSAGSWQALLKLDRGVNVIYARTHKNNNAPEHGGDDDDDDDDDDERGGWSDYRQSNVVLLKVNPELKWDPISLNFAKPNGDVAFVRHWLGWFEDTGWYVGLQPSTTYTVGVRVCCQDPSTATVTMTVAVGKGDAVTETVLTLTDPDGDQVFTTAWTTRSARELKHTKLHLCVRGDGVLSCARGRAFPVWPKPNHTVFISDQGFDTARLTVVPGDVVEFVNMDVKARTFSSVQHLLSQTNTPATLSEDDDAVRLEVGESMSVQVENASVTYFDSQNSTESITLAMASNRVYLPVTLR
jgi:uncharacterized repeat protein (TIGR01451 family)